jgi:RNA-binding protein
MNNNINIHELKLKARDIEPTIRVGKLGLSQGTIAEIQKQLKKRRMIKIKILKNFLFEHTKDEIIKLIVDKTNSRLIEKKGFIITLFYDAKKEIVV